MVSMTTEITVINDALNFAAQLLKLQKRDSSFSLTKIADKLLVLDSRILFTISLTALIFRIPISQKYRGNLTNTELRYLLAL